jgi:hypothetical protein
MMSEMTTLWRKACESGLWLLLAGVLLQAVIWRFPVQRAMGGRGDEDSALLLALHVMAVVGPGLLAMAAMREPRRPVKGLWLAGWVLGVGGMAGMVGVMGTLWTLQELGRFEWSWGFKLMCWAGVIGAVGLGVFWKLLSGRGVWAMSVASAMVSLVGVVGMYWWMRPYFYGVEHLYRYHVWDGDFSGRLAAGVTLAIVLWVLMARVWKRDTAGLRAGAMGGEQDFDQSISTRLLTLTLVAQLVGPVACIVLAMLLSMAGVWVRPLAFVMLGFVVAQPLTGVWLMLWAHKHRVKLMTPVLHGVLLWRYLWLGFLAAGVMGGVSVAVLSALFGGMNELIAVTCFGMSVGVAVMYPLVWRGLKGKAVFEYLWMITWGETAVGLMLMAFAGEGIYREEWVFFFAMSLAMLMPGVVGLGARASIEHEREMIDGRVKGICTGCGYDLTGTLAAGREECPECGVRLGTVSHAPSV